MNRPENTPQIHPPKCAAYEVPISLWMKNLAVSKSVATDISAMYA